MASGSSPGQAAPPFTSEQVERYSRQILLREVGGVGQRRLLNASVAIAGLNGVGAAAARLLAGAGVGRLILIDPTPTDARSPLREIGCPPERVGVPRSEVVADSLRAFNPDVAVVIGDEAARDGIEADPSRIEETRDPGGSAVGETAAKRDPASALFSPAPDLMIDCLAPREPPLIDAGDAWFDEKSRASAPAERGEGSGGGAQRAAVPDSGESVSGASRNAPVPGAEGDVSSGGNGEIPTPHRRLTGVSEPFPTGGWLRAWTVERSGYLAVNPAGRPCPLCLEAAVEKAEQAFDSPQRDPMGSDNPDVWAEMLPGLMGSLVAGEALRILLEFAPPAPVLRRFSGVDAAFSDLPAPARPDCPQCGSRQSGPQGL